MSDRANRRRDERLDVRVPTICRAPASPHRATVQDISYGGCRVSVDSLYIPKGSTVILDLALRQVSGQVAWTESGSAGIKFHRQLASELAVHFGVEEAPVAPVSEETPPPDPAQLGLSHWLRRAFGIITERTKNGRAG